MGMAEDIYEELKVAMRAKDRPRLLALRNIRDDLQKAEKAKLEPLTEDEMTQNLARQAKRCRDAAGEFRGGGRDDMADKEEAELAIILEYLPEQMTRDQIVDLAKGAIEAAGATGPGDMGKVMGQLVPETRGRAEGREVSEVVRELLQSS